MLTCIQVSCGYILQASTHLECAVALGILVLTLVSFDRRLFWAILYNRCHLLHVKGNTYQLFFDSSYDAGSKASRNRQIIIGSLTALCVTIAGNLILQWYYIDVVTQQPTKMDMYIRYESVNSATSHSASVEIPSILNYIFMTCGNIVADGLMVRQ